MEETQNNCQSPSVWGSMQDLTSWSFNDHENGEESAQNYTEGPCDRKAPGTIVTKKTIAIMQCPQGPPAQESTCTASSEVCQWTSEWFRGELDESLVVRWDQIQALRHQLNSPFLEEVECCLWPQEHHPQRSGSRSSTLRSWSGLASLQTLIPWKICAGSWRFELPNVRLETLMTWRGSGKRSGTKSLLGCVNLVANYNKRLTTVFASKGFDTKHTKSCFAKGSNTFFHSLKCKSIYNFFEMRFSGFVCVSVSHC